MVFTQDVLRNKVLNPTLQRLFDDSIEYLRTVSIVDVFTTQLDPGAPASECSAQRKERFKVIIAMQLLKVLSPGIWSPNYNMEAHQIRPTGDGKYTDVILPDDLSNKFFYNLSEWDQFHTMDRNLGELLNQLNYLIPNGMTEEEVDKIMTKPDIGLDKVADMINQHYSAYCYEGSTYVNLIWDEYDCDNEPHMYGHINDNQLAIIEGVDWFLLVSVIVKLIIIETKGIDDLLIANNAVKMLDAIIEGLPKHYNELPLATRGLEVEVARILNRALFDFKKLIQDYINEAALENLDSVCCNVIRMSEYHVARMKSFATLPSPEVGIADIMIKSAEMAEKIANDTSSNLVFNVEIKPEDTFEGHIYSVLFQHTLVLNKTDEYMKYSYRKYLESMNKEEEK